MSDGHNGRIPAEDRTVYWTLSFYIPREKIEPFAPDLPRNSRDFADELRRQQDVDLPTMRMRQAIDPLFNDVADRSRLGKVEDFLFAGLSSGDVELTLPATIEWMTEGKKLVVDLADGKEVRQKRDFKFCSFWYVHGNGSVSWHAGLSHRYAAQMEQERGGVPTSLYLISLLQKLAWPKEFDPERGKDCDGLPCNTDRLVGIEIEDVAFWDYVTARFNEDAGAKLPAIFRDAGWHHADAQQSSLFKDLIEVRESVEVPGLSCPVTRSCFFFQDKAFFKLIQPKQDGRLIGRSNRVLDQDFVGYPEMIESLPVSSFGKRMLGADYWRKIHQDGGVFNEPGDGRLEQRTAENGEVPDPTSEVDRPDAYDRLAYLFLAGFNQNIIDFMNQEASEVLDSLDPIYPRLEEQEKEGFFIRFANPRSMITYVPRSRTLEVGNDFIGTCPYAFLIHALSMHNEALTRAQEKATFKAIGNIVRKIESAETLIEKKNHTAAATSLRDAEKAINRTRMEAFFKFDQHRYANPFRYDTERDVFTELEQLRGTSRLKVAYEAALAALDEQANDIMRIRNEGEAEAISQRERRISYLFSFLGFTGLAGLLLSTDAFLRDHAGWTFTRHSSEILALLYWGGSALIFLGVLCAFRFSKK